MAKNCSPKLTQKRNFTFVGKLKIRIDRVINFREIEILLQHGNMVSGKFVRNMLSNFLNMNIEMPNIYTQN